MQKKCLTVGARNSNLELLRIFMIISIIAHHYVVNSGVTLEFDYNRLNFNMIFLQIVGMWGRTAINTFTIITGYFSVKKGTSVRKILKLYFTIKFWSFLSAILFHCTGYYCLDAQGLYKLILNVVYDVNVGYIGTMMILMLAIPILNVLANNMTKKQYQYLILLILGYFMVMATFLEHDTFNFTGWLISAYMIGGYLRLYPLKYDNIKMGLLGICVSVLLMCVSILYVDFIASKHGFDSAYYMVSNCNKLLPILASVSLFFLFKNLKIKNSKIINTIASATFGVLIIHANSDTMRKFLWVTVFNCVEHYYTKWMPIYVCLVVLGIYVVCVILELLRMKYIEKPFFVLLDKITSVNKR
ncbi:acyltransferase [Kineothrix sp. MSJ-39]|uniref:acyltransferase family protein n=1 Tax=Kineothrix sp. MSJ-39 TaxID=2841533 RepID=UPI001C0FFFA1|nr:acyltransferase family protein [Kineothrix sp. MSJ-39]MBU5428778.1 acyltransferase [Kineothrix sp. MSJ-39]